MKRHINPPAYFMTFLLLTALLHFTVPIMHLVSTPYTYLGILGIGFGMIINIWADAVFKLQNTTVKPYERPSTLVTSGPFSISRNPMYLGMFAILFGEAIFLGSLSVLFMPFIFVMFIEYIFIRREEKNMELAFGEHYQLYRKSVHKWV